MRRKKLSASSILFAAAASAVGPLLGDADIETLWTMTTSLLTAAAAKLLHAARLTQPAASKSLSDPLVEIEKSAPAPFDEHERQADVVSR
jgi:hypothetical protein